MPKYLLTDSASYLGKVLHTYLTRPDSENELVEVANWDDEEEVQSKILQAEVVVLDLVRSPIESQTVLANIMPEKLEEEQTLKIIGISSVMTWNKTNTKANAKPVKEADFKGRKTSTKYKGLKMLETSVLNAGKDAVKTFVLAPGILYGNGEEEFANLFKDGWLCENPAGLPVLGEGSNIIPTMHVNDVAVALDALVAKPPEENQYVVVSDNTNSTQRQIVETISKGIGLGLTTQMDPADDKVLLGNNNSEVVLLNLSFDPEGSWQAGAGLELTCAGGLAAEFQRVRSEFVTNRGLKPVRALVLGGPGAGKTMFAKKLADKFYLPYVSVGDVIEETCQQEGEFAESVKAAVAEMNAAKAKAKKPAAKPKKGAKGSYKPDDRPRLPTEMVAKMMKNKLLSAACSNKGFILDGFPRSLEEAQKLFKAEGEAGEEEAPEEADEEVPEGEEAPPKAIKVDESVFPSFVVSLDCTEDCARQRFKDLPEDQIVADHNDEDGFDRRWARFEWLMDPQAEVVQNPLDFFKQLEVLEVPQENTGMCINK